MPSMFRFTVYETLTRSPRQTCSSPVHPDFIVLLWVSVYTKGAEENICTEEG
jgi:hypothetical protein